MFVNSPDQPIAFATLRPSFVPGPRPVAAVRATVSQPKRAARLARLVAVVSFRPALSR